MDVEMGRWTHAEGRRRGDGRQTTLGHGLRRHGQRPGHEAGREQRSSGMRNAINAIKVVGGIGIVALGTLEPVLGAISWMR